MDYNKYFILDQEWINQYPDAKIGILVIKNIKNVVNDNELEKVRKEVEIKFRNDFRGFSREDINNLSIIKIYNDYYKNFSKTYHVRSQVESVINGKSLSSRSALLTAMFMAEVKNMLLTAGHDLATLDLPVQVKISHGEENFVDIRGSQKQALIGDMIMMDGKGVISSIILGPDQRTKLTDDVEDVLFAVYAPSAIQEEVVLSHLKDIENYIKIFSRDSKTDFLGVFKAV